jgi:hypothetical protein
MERYKCKFCNGKGTIYFLIAKTGSGVGTCIVCGGDKTVDWVTNVTQKRKITGLDLSQYTPQLKDDGNVYFEFIGS